MVIFIILFYIVGICVQYVRIHTVHKDWLERRKEWAEGEMYPF